MIRKVCECCLSGDLRHEGKHSHYDRYICSECRFEFYSWDGHDVTNKPYENDADYQFDLEVSRSHDDLMQWNHRKALARVKRMGFPGARCLDIGCFNGFFVKKLLECGFDAYGIDFNETAVDYGVRNYGLEGRIFPGNVEDLVREKSNYDVITLLEVLEHVASPRRFLYSVKTLLNPGGILFISVPNNNMIWRPALDFPPHHLSRYYPETIDRILTSLGFDIVDHLEQMNAYDLARNYVGSLFRAGNAPSLRGGRFRNRVVANTLRTMMNKLRTTGYVLLFPVDASLHFLGVRYISQLVVATNELRPADSAIG